MPESRFWESILAGILYRASNENIAALIRSVVRRRLTQLPPADGLRFLFGLDDFLYKLQGQKSIEYGGGTHTKHRHTQYHDFFVNHITPGERILDIGCGNGALSYDIAERAGASVVGIDNNLHNIENARRRRSHPNITYIVGDALHDLPEQRFDTVVLSNVLEHLPERPAFLQKVLQAARSSRFLIRVPLFERDWRVPLKHELGVEWRLDATHETEYTVESFAEEVAAADMSIDSQELRWGEIWAVVRPLKALP